MFSSRRSWIVVAACLALVVAGCQPKTPSPKPAEEKKKPDTAANDVKVEKVPESKPAKPSAKAATRKPKAEHPPMPATVSKVVLSSEFRSNCLVDVGQAMPRAELPDIAGKPHTLESLHGERLTVVCLWTIGTGHRSQLLAAAAMQDLAEDVAGPFARQGVRVVGIDVGDTPEVVQQEVKAAGAAFPVLLDSKGEYFAKIAKDKRMPRVFLLDAEGRVLWFDIEYSRNSRDDLVRSIQAVLGKL
jgi:hypothetical protein